MHAVRHHPHHYKFTMQALFSQHARLHVLLPVMGSSSGRATGPRTPPCPAFQRRCVHRRPLPARRSSTIAAPGAASAASAEPLTEQQQAFQDLQQQAASLSAASSTSSAPAAAVTLQPCEHGSGLFLTRDVAPGDVVLTVPASLCLMVDYSQGLRLPQAEWPRVRRQLARDDATPWDLLLAVAQLDALAGAGGPFWERYAAALLPQPAQLTLPFCLPDGGDAQLLGQLQHSAIEEGARAQKARLAGMFPGLSTPMCEGGPTWVEWAFGCVRSRSFKLADDVFALVPFLDLANHAPAPTCAFRLSQDRAVVEMVAVAAAQAGAEATISYTGPEGMTNQRLMAQYGFVPPHGNPADRIAFAALAAPGDAEQQQQQQPAGGSSTATSSDSGSDSSSGGGSNKGSSQRVLLSLDRLQASLGDGEAMAAAFSGRDPYAYAALKSLPLALEEADAAHWPQQSQLAAALLGELEAEQAAWPTSPAQDQQQLSSLQEPGGAEADPRLAAAVQYRLQRKLLVSAAAAILRRFLDS